LLPLDYFQELFIDPENVAVKHPLECDSGHFLLKNHISDRRISIQASAGSADMTNITGKSATMNHNILKSLVIIVFLTLSGALFAVPQHQLDDGNSFQEGLDAYEERNYEYAFEVWDRLARRDHKEAQYYLGRMYELGQFVINNDFQAFDWYAKSAAQGYVPAMYQMGRLYEEGKGIAKDYYEAYRWYALASDEGYEKATDALYALKYKEKQLKEKAIEEALAREEKKIRGTAEDIARAKMQAELVKKARERAEIEAKEREEAAKRKIAEARKNAIALEKARKKAIKDAITQNKQRILAESEAEVRKEIKHKIRNEVEEQIRTEIENQLTTSGKGLVRTTVTKEEIQTVAEKLALVTRVAPTGAKTEKEKEQQAKIAEEIAAEKKAKQEQANRFVNGMKAFDNKNYNTAMSLLSPFAESGIHLAQYRVAHMYEKGLGVERNVDRAQEIYKVLASKGDIRSQIALADISMEDDSREVDMALLKDLARKGHLKSQYRLGEMYYYGKGVPSDLVQSAVWYRMAAEKGHAKAQLKLGEMYADGKGVSQFYGDAAKWFEKSARQDLPRAQARLGQLYRFGHGVKKDMTQALFWLRKAAGRDDTEAMRTLGEMYVEGQGVNKDLALGADWLQQASEKGNAQAQFKLGIMYRDGKGLPQDFGAAVKWLTDAARQGITDAYYYLGNMYFTGKGSNLDYVESHKWWNIAAGLGDKRSRSYRDIVAARMSEEQIQTAHRLSREWRREYTKLSANLQ